METISLLNPFAAFTASFISGVSASSSVYSPSLVCAFTSAPLEMRKWKISGFPSEQLRWRGDQPSLKREKKKRGKIIYFLATSRRKKKKAFFLKKEENSGLPHPWH